jgi:hypothetical protein
VSGAKRKPVLTFACCHSMLLACHGMACLGCDAVHVSLLGVDSSLQACMLSSLPACTYSGQLLMRCWRCCCKCSSNNTGELLVSPPVYQALLGWPASKTAVNSFVTYTINW